MLTVKLIVETVNREQFLKKATLKGEAEFLDYYECYN